MLYEFKGKSPQIDPSSFVSNSAEIIGDVTIGPRCYIGPGVVIRGDSAHIDIGEESAVEDGVIIHCGGSGIKCCSIGRRVTIGHGAIVHASRLGEGASIGMGAVLSIGSELAERSVLAECALLKRNQLTEESTLYAGIPAKPVRALLERDITSWESTKDWYVKLTSEYMTPSLFHPID